MVNELADFTRDSFSSGGRTHDLYRKGAGPAVIVISEIPGITPKVAEFARRVVGIGCSAVLPHLFGEPGQPPSAAYAIKTLASLCVSREFSGLAMGRSTPVISWLRGLAAAEHVRCGGPGVGVVGMCYTGGFALGMAVDEAVVAPVLSQPSLPFPVSRARKADIQLSPTDWTTLQARADAGMCVLGLRFSGDKASPPERFQTLRDKLGDRFIAVELDSSSGNPYGHPRAAHSVLTEHLDDREGTPTRAALDQVLDFLATRLSPPAPGD
jgi:dienelactone hydrolase